MGETVFYGCTSLTEIIFPETATNIGLGCFYGCTAITAADLSTTKVTALASNTFRGCRALTRVDFPNGLTTIGSHSLYGCSALTDLRIPASVVKVRWQAFQGCTALHTLVVESTAVRFESVHLECWRWPLPLHDRTHDHFSGCTSLAAISVPDLDHAMTTWPHDKMFTDCPTQLPELLAAATPSMQLRYYWRPGAHGHALLCLPSEREAVRTVVLVAARLMHRHRDSAHSAAEQRQRQNPCTARQTQPTALPDLPDELWFCILSLIKRHELGGDAV